jgi:signal transduction histidine kinase
MTAGKDSARAREMQRAFISEMFHDLSQPLTALHCSLDLALNRDTTVEEFRGSVQTALEVAERLRQRLQLVRMLSDADDPGDLSQPVELVELFHELREDMLPLYDAGGQRLEVKVAGRSILVRGDRARLMRALFCFMEYLFRYSREGALHSIRVRARHRQHAEISITAAGCLPIGPSLDDLHATPYSCEIEMIRRSFGAAGGEFALVSCVPDQSVWRAVLPLS